MGESKMILVTWETQLQLQMGSLAGILPVIYCIFLKKIGMKKLIILQLLMNEH